MERGQDSFVQNIELSSIQLQSVEHNFNVVYFYTPSYPLISMHVYFCSPLFQPLAMNKYLVKQVMQLFDIHKSHISIVEDILKQIVYDNQKGLRNTNQWPHGHHGQRYHQLHFTIAQLNLQLLNNGDQLNLSDPSHFSCEHKPQNNFPSCYIFPTKNSSSSISTNSNPRLFRIN